MRRLFPDNEKLLRWIGLLKKNFVSRFYHQELHGWSYGERAKMGLALNKLVRDGEISAP